MGIQEYQRRVVQEYVQIRRIREVLLHDFVLRREEQEVPVDIAESVDDGISESIQEIGGVEYDVLLWNV